MTIDKQILQKLLWSEVASWKADCAEWKQKTEALGEFLGEKTVEEVALELLAENQDLKTACAAFDRVNTKLKAEIEVLRKECDARHPFKPFHEPAIGFTGCVICGVYTDHGGLPCPKTRAAAIALSMENQRLTPVEPLRVPHPLEAAMGKGEQS